MTMNLNSFLLVLSLVLLLLAALKTPEPARVSFGWMGLFLWMLLQVIR